MARARLANPATSPLTSRSAVSRPRSATGLPRVRSTLAATCLDWSRDRVGGRIVHGVEDASGGRRRHLIAAYRRDFGAERLEVRLVNAVRQIVEHRGCQFRRRLDQDQPAGDATRGLAAVRSGEPITRDNASHRRVERIQFTGENLAVSDVSREVKHRCSFARAFPLPRL
jgi:hypothetical protein